MSIFAWASTHSCNIAVAFFCAAAVAVSVCWCHSNTPFHHVGKSIWCYDFQDEINCCLSFSSVSLHFILFFYSCSCSLFSKLQKREHFSIHSISPLKLFCAARKTIFSHQKALSWRSQLNFLFFCLLFCSILNWKKINQGLGNF